MSESIRAFLAVELPAEIKATLARVATSLRNEGIRGVRAVDPEGVHLTLKFLGSTRAELIDAVLEAVGRKAGDLPPFAVETGAVWAFPSEGAPRIIWVGIDGNLSRLDALQTAVSDASATLGFEPESRRYSPHLTVARIGEHASPAERVRTLEVVRAAWLGEGLLLPVKSIALMRSHLTPKGARYERLTEVPLGGSTRR